MEEEKEAGRGEGKETYHLCTSSISSSPSLRVLVNE